MRGILPAGIILFLIIFAYTLSCDRTKEEVPQKKKEIPKEQMTAKKQEIAEPSVKEEEPPGKPASEEPPKREEPPKPVEEVVTILKDREQLKTVMEAAELNMIKLKDALRFENWDASRQAAARLEELIGNYCINLYLKMNPTVSEEFVIISQRFYNSLFNILIAEISNNFDAAWTQYVQMKADCGECHSKFRKEGGAVAPTKK
ncbi:MAG TPA: hypothetical protein ACFYD2_10260 [Candidatus Avalokitesvara rifleensis]|uniref:hypothetical protein n=1 Tax=Candidatus Avalokitesvara rifleensis TaxID=3367620 RepID=UPI004025DEBA